MSLAAVAQMETDRMNPWTSSCGRSTTAGMRSSRRRKCMSSAFPQWDWSIAGQSWAADAPRRGELHRKGLCVLRASVV